MTPARIALQGECRELALRSAVLAQTRHRDFFHLQFGALYRRSLGDKLEAEGEGGGDDLAQVTDFEVDLRYLPSFGVVGGYADYRLGYGELVQGSVLSRLF